MSMFPQTKLLSEVCDVFASVSVAHDALFDMAQALRSGKVSEETSRGDLDEILRNLRAACAPTSTAAGGHNDECAPAGNRH